MSKKEYIEKFGKSGEFMDGIMGEKAICAFASSSEAFREHFPKSDLEEPALVKKLVSTAVVFNKEGNYALYSMEFITKALEVLALSLTNFHTVTFSYHKSERREPLLIEGKRGAIIIAPRVDAPHENALEKAKEAYKSGERGIFPDFCKTDFTKVKGVGEHTQNILVQNGVWSIQDIEHASDYYLENIKGIGAKTIQRIKEGF